MTMKEVISFNCGTWQPFGQQTKQTSSSGHWSGIVELNRAKGTLSAMSHRKVRT
jgi:hypothetical protein